MCHVVHLFDAVRVEIDTKGCKRVTLTLSILHGTYIHAHADISRPSRHEEVPNGFGRETQNPQEVMRYMHP